LNGYAERPIDKAVCDLVQQLMLWSFVITSIIIELTPGPNMTWLAVLGANKGRVPALAAVAGIALGLAIAAVVAGLGLTALLYQFPILFEVLRWAGTLYLFYLAYDAWTDADGVSTAVDGGAARSFFQGLATNTLNPKAYLFYAAVVPRFVDSSSDALQQIVLLSAIYVAVATGIHAGIAVMAGSAAEFLQHSPKAVLLRKSMAVIIAIAAVWFFVSTRMTT
jgi:threonine/homoserine/homoserine lactone efflux protein